MPVKSFASLVTAVVVAEVAGSAEVLALSATLSADTLSDVLTDTLADALDASKTCEEAATLEASVELQAVKLSAALTIAAAMVNFFFIVDSSSFRFSVYERQEVPRGVLPQRLLRVIVTGVYRVFLRLQPRPSRSRCRR